MECQRRNCLPIRGRGGTTRPRCSKRYSRWGATGSFSPAANTAAWWPRPTPISTCKLRPVRRVICAKAWMPISIGWRASFPDFRINAKNIFGMRGTHYSLTAATKCRRLIPLLDYAGSTGEIWPHPYWLSAGGWCVRPFWDHYLATGDLDFLRNRVVPAYKDSGAVLRGFPDGHRQERQLHLRSRLSRRRTTRQHRSRRDDSDQCHHGHYGVPRSA